MAHLPDFSHDPHRPIYHFLPPANWMNDPNGLMQHRGRYHMFYQHYPYGAYWSTMHWGHAVSDDLVHWRHLPLALTPTPGGADRDGCFSGCAVIDGGVPVLVYTGVRPQVQCLAFPDDPNDPDLVGWHAYEGNPVLVQPEGLDLLPGDFRDPCVWREGDGWQMALGSGVQGVGGVILLYRSRDLIHWEYVRPILTGDREQVDPLPTGTMWECPGFFRLQDRHVLLVSAMGMQDGARYTVYWSGGYENFTFKPDVLRLLDYGREQFYAPQTFLDDSNAQHSQGRKLMFGWLVENRSPGEQRAAGWAGVMSLPRVLTLRPDGTLNMSPAPEVQTLRGKGRRWEGVRVTPERSNWLDGLQGDALEIRAEFAPPLRGEFGLAVRCSPDGLERTTISYNAQTQQLAVNLAHSSLDDQVGRGHYSGELRLSPGEPLVLDVFLDRSVIEVYANERACISSRVYPTLAESKGVDLWASNAVTVHAVDVWEMAGIW
ncbi:MAG: glycoside hydrolase family 32 protein [Anaerolineae bacterium]|nr:glycoside hydrolase family 32 protein [Anaerolineae bacterium]